MAKMVNSESTKKVMNAREEMQQLIGNFLANKEGTQIDRLRDGILVVTDDGDVVVKVILKKAEIEFTEEDVLETYDPTDVEEDEEEA